MGDRCTWAVCLGRGTLGRAGSAQQAARSARHCARSDPQPSGGRRPSNRPSRTTGEANEVCGAARLSAAVSVPETVAQPAVLPASQLHEGLLDAPGCTTSLPPSAAHVRNSCVHARTHARTQARTPAGTHARAQAPTHARTPARTRTHLVASVLAHRGLFVRGALEVDVLNLQRRVASPGDMSQPHCAHCHAPHAARRMHRPPRRARCSTGSCTQGNAAAAWQACALTGQPRLGSSPGGRGGAEGRARPGGMLIARRVHVCGPPCYGARARLAQHAPHAAASAHAAPRVPRHSLP